MNKFLDKSLRTKYQESSKSHYNDEEKAATKFKSRATKASPKASNTVVIGNHKFNFHLVAFDGKSVNKHIVAMQSLTNPGDKNKIPLLSELSDGLTMKKLNEFTDRSSSSSSPTHGINVSQVHRHHLPGSDSSETVNKNFKVLYDYESQADKHRRELESDIERLQSRPQEFTDHSLEDLMFRGSNYGSLSAANLFKRRHRKKKMRRRRPRHHGKSKVRTLLFFDVVVSPT